MKRRQGWGGVELKKLLVTKFGKNKPEKVLGNPQTNSIAITQWDHLWEQVSIWLALKVDYCKSVAQISTVNQREMKHY